MRFAATGTDRGRDQPERQRRWRRRNAACALPAACRQPRGFSGCGAWEGRGRGLLC